MMTVGELIDLLKAFPSDMRVVTSGYEGGCCDASKPEQLTLALNVNTAWYYGSHEAVSPWDGDRLSKFKHEPAVIIR